MYASVVLDGWNPQYLGHLCHGGQNPGTDFAEHGSREHQHSGAGRIDFAKCSGGFRRHLRGGSVACGQLYSDTGFFNLSHFRLLPSSVTVGTADVTNVNFTATSSFFMVKHCSRPKLPH